ncbi:helix-turn-helix domain-containing protein [Planktotalea sp.]|uniref:helix-turn-helix domain-containing protein n=1 Tax=Planktotalea sp. TaxID=2029877 RepID=UPI0035C7CBD5
MTVKKTVSKVGAVPSYGLYGELLSGDYRDPVHHETIRERSSRHNWTIRLHRHRGLAQIFLLRAGKVSYRIEDSTFTNDQPCVLFIPPGIAHGFRFDENVEGDVLSLRVNDLWAYAKTALEQAEFSTVALLAQGRCENLEYIDAAFAQLGPIYHGMKRERDAILQALVRLILTYIAGDVGRTQSNRMAHASESVSRHEKQAEAFCTLLEARFSEDLLVNDYAKEIGVSAPHLTRVCKQVLGSAPNALIRQRRILEASRLLEYTRLPVSEVSHRSGFKDPSFFTRTFRSAYGIPPKTYRATKDVEGLSRSP